MKIQTRRTNTSQPHRYKTDPYYNSREHRRFKNRVWANAQGVCERCDKKGKLKQLVRGTKNKDRQGVADHIIPREAGGSDIAEENGQLLCNSCHAIKSNQDKKRYY